MSLLYSPQGSHGDNGVPKRSWDASEGSAFHILFTVEHDSGKDNNGHGQREHQEAQL